MIIENKTFDAERALYGTEDIEAVKCRFDGPADGESAFKECRRIKAKDCFFNLRYPFWHDIGLVIEGGEMTEKCRAALWYTENAEISGLKMHGIKALRECRNISLESCEVISPEFAWSVAGFKIRNSSVESEYFCMRSSELDFAGLTLNGKYSFQYVEGGILENCVLNTKDAFWHSKNVTVRNSVIKGEYLGWYSENLTLDHCKITGTQPLCYCKGLRLIDCEMHDCDLAFEKSEAEATVTTPVISIKNPYAGSITVPECGEIIMDDERAGAEINITRQETLFIGNGE